MIRKRSAPDNYATIRVYDLGEKWEYFLTGIDEMAAMELAGKMSRLDKEAIYAAHNMDKEVDPDYYWRGHLEYSTIMEQVPWSTERRWIVVFQDRNHRMVYTIRHDLTQEEAQNLCETLNARYNKPTGTYGVRETNRGR